jgi:hypothetical protein
MWLGDNKNRGRKEDVFDVKIPERHAGKGDGTTKDGTVIANEVLKQPWVEKDGICGDPTNDVIGSGGKDVG